MSITINVKLDGLADYCEVLSALIESRLRGVWLNRDTTLAAIASIVTYQEHDDHVTFSHAIGVNGLTVTNMRPFASISHGHLGDINALATAGADDAAAYVTTHAAWFDLYTY